MIAIVHRPFCIFLRDGLHLKVESDSGHDVLLDSDKLFGVVKIAILPSPGFDSMKKARRFGQIIKAEY